MRKIWFVTVTAVTVTQWTQRNESIFNAIARTPTEAAAATKSTCLRQPNALSDAMVRTRSERVLGICLSQCISALENIPHDRTAAAERVASLHFDEGARGNPGPGDSGRALAILDPWRQAWTMRSCGYKYQGAQATNNECDYDALLSSIAFASTELRSTRKYLIITGVSNLITDQKTGRATIKAEYLKAKA